MAFSQQGPRAVCILSANGSVSTVTLRQPSTSGGTVTYEVWHFLCVMYLLKKMQIEHVWNLNLNLVKRFVFSSEKTSHFCKSESSSHKNI